MAYLEPGSTSFLLKILVSGLAGFILASRYIWRAIRSLFAKNSSRRQEKETADR
jgi:hypothetical protein